MTMASHSRWQLQIDSYSSFLRAGNLSAGTVALRRKYLDRLARHAGDAGPWDLTADDLIDFMQNPAWGAEMRKGARSTLRGFYDWGVTSDRTTTDPARRLPSVTVPAGKPRPAPDSVYSHALHGADARAFLMVMLASKAGLRRAEIAGIHTRDIIGDELRIKGKGGKVRVIPVHAELVPLLADLPHGYLFPGKDGGHLAPDSVGRIVTRLLGPGWTTHTLRHRFASRAYAANRDIRAVQEALGHSKPETTARYTAIPDGAVRAAVDAA